MLDITAITDALSPSGEPVQYRVPPEKLIAGDPLQTLTPGFTSPCGRFSTGIWESTPGRWRVAYTEAEYCEILAGTSVITDEEGNAKTLRAGHRFVIPPGFRGTWEVVERTRKIFVAYEAGAGVSRTGSGAGSVTAGRRARRGSRTRPSRGPRSDSCGSRASRSRSASTGRTRHRY